MTKATPQVVIKEGHKPNPVMSMIIPGRRALGEDWSKVNVFAGENGYTSEREDTPAPADGKAIFVPGMGNVSTEMADFILEQQRHMAIERLRHPNRPDPRSEADRINAMWHDFVEQKLRAFKGQSTFGPGGHTQREKVKQG